MLGLQVSLQHAQQVKRYLMEHDLFDKRYSINREEGRITFPVSRQFSPPFDFEIEFIEIAADERIMAQSLRDAMKPLLTPDEHEEFIGSYDIVGSIAILEIPDALLLKEQLIAEKVMMVNKAVKTVLKKIGGHEGEFRTQRMQHLAGEDTRETFVIENGVKLKVNVEEAYYSIRMSSERKRILEQIKPGEHILCLFSGVGPYPVLFSVKSKATTIVGVEINPAAHELAQENAARNRCTNVRLLCGDAHEIIPKLVAAGEKFDRVTMPLPHTADEFLDDVMRISRPGTIIHYYTFLPDGEFNNAIQLLKNVTYRHGFKLAAYDVAKAGQHAPRVWRICVDALLG